MALRWISAVLLVGAGFAAAIITHDGWWVVAGVLLGALADRVIRLLARG